MCNLNTCKKGIAIALSAVMSIGAVGTAIPTQAVAEDATEIETQTANSVTYTIHKSNNPTDDQKDAYARIESAMKQATAIWNERAPYKFHIDVYYNTGVPTAEGGPNNTTSGRISFGANRSYMVTGTALHEIAHCMGVGYYDYGKKISSGDAKRATHALQKYDGAGAKLNYGGSHIWPYGLNYASEWAKNTQRMYDGNVDIVAALRLDIIDGSSVGGISKDLIFTTSENITIGANKASTIDIDTNQDFASTFTITSGSLPTGLSIDTNTGKISGSTNDTGIHTFIVDAYNGIEHKTQTINLSVQSAPSIETSNLPSGEVGKQYDAKIETSGFPNPVIAITGLPDGLEYDKTTGTITGTPTESGIFDVTIEATNDEGNATKATRITIDEKQPQRPSNTGNANTTVTANNSNVSASSSNDETKQTGHTASVDVGKLPQTGISVIITGITTIASAIVAVFTTVSIKRKR